MGTGKNEKWDITNAVLSNKEKYQELQLQLYNLMYEFSFLAARTFEKAKGEPLNILQINQVVTHEFEVVKATLEMPDIIDVISRKIELELMKE